MEGLYIGKTDKPVETASQNSAQLSLLANGEGPEVMVYKILANKEFYIYPSESIGTMEFYYILEGTVIYPKQEHEISLTKGDYFYTKDLKSTVFFTTLTDVQVLYVSTQPIFKELSNSINILTETIKKIQEKDQYTFKHSENVQKYSMAIAKQMNLTRESIENLNFASIFHDAGKIFIDDDILNKKEKLTDEEMKRIKEHPVLGSNLARGQFWEKVSQVIEMHHERIDGTGYPKALKGDQILLEAKIIAVADTFDAMTTDRPYRRALDPIDAINEIKGLSGSHYEPEVVEALEQILIDQEKIKTRNS